MIHYLSTQKGRNEYIKSLETQKSVKIKTGIIMKNYTERLEDLWEEMRLEVIKKVKEIGKESSFTTEKTIKVSCCQNADLNFDYELKEVGGA